MVVDYKQQWTLDAVLPCFCLLNLKTSYWEGSVQFSVQECQCQYRREEAYSQG